MWWWRLIVVWIAGAALCPGADEPPPPIDLSRFNTAEFGRLPAWFNGRATTLAGVAANTLARSSGQTEWHWSDGASLSAAEWIFAVAFDHDRWRDAEVLLVDDPAIAELLELPPAGEAGPVRFCSLRTATDRMDRLQSRLEALRQPGAAADATQAAWQRFFRRLQDVGDLLTVFRMPAMDDPQVMLDEAQQARQLAGQAVPLVLPPRLTGGEWETLQWGVIFHRVGQDGSLETNPAAGHWLALYEVRQDSDRFNPLLAAYTEYVRGLGCSDCPFGFAVPSGWTEIGTPQTREAALFSDTLAFGNTVAVLELRAGTQSASLRLNHFPGPVAPRERIVDDWRISEGLAPAPLRSSDTTPIQACGADGWCVDMVAPPALTGRDERLLGAGFEHGGSYWVATLTGPDELVSRHRADLAAFLQSLRLGTQPELERWFPYTSQQHPGPDRQFTLLAAVVPVTDAVWVLQTPVLADQLPEARATELRAWAESLTAATAQPAPGQPPFGWTLPPGWEALSPPQQDYVLTTASEPTPLWWSLRPLLTDRGFEIARLVQHWREGARLPRLTAAELETAVTPLATPLGEGWLVRYDIPVSLP